jgi:soluble lytic murein transglycosylase
VKSTLIRLLAVCAFAIFTLRCSTTPSEANLEDQSRKQTEEQHAWIQSYKQAQSVVSTNPEQACQIFTELEKTKKFLIGDLALERAHLVCLRPETLPAIPSEWSEKRPWLEPVDSLRSLREAELSGNPKKLASALIERSRQATMTREKELLLARAIEQAQLAQDNSLIEEATNRYYKTAPRLNPNPSKKEWAHVGQDLLNQREFKKAREQFEKIVNGDEFSIDEKYQALRQIRNSYKVEQNKSEYLVAIRRLLAWAKKNSAKLSNLRISESYITLARSLWTEGDTSQARTVLNDALKDLGTQVSGEDIYFILGRIDEESENFDGALKNYRMAEAASKDKGPSRERILFSQAWILRKKQAYEEAAMKFAQLQKETEDIFAQHRYQFWQARSWEQADQKGVAQMQFQILSQADPLGYYGLVSYYKMGLLLPPLKKPDSAKPISLEPSSKRSMDLTVQRTLRALVEVGEKEVLAKYISRQVPSLRLPASVNVSDESTLFVFGNLAEAGLYQPLFAELALLTPSTREKLLQDHPELLFPRRYLDLIEPASAKFGIEPELVLSIIRQESSFDPQARSGADAFGLMQVLPSIAHLQEKRTHVHFDNHEDLYNPDINIPIGTSLLADLSKKYHGQLILTAAAYNASEKAISNWLKVRLKQDPLEFIEDIPYEETRSYVKLVMRNYIFYRRLSHPEESLAFPTRCLEDLRSIRDSNEAAKFAVSH